MVSLLKIFGTDHKIDFELAPPSSQKGRILVHTSDLHTRTNKFQANTDTKKLHRLEKLRGDPQRALEILEKLRSGKYLDFAKHRNDQIDLVLLGDILDITWSAPLGEKLYDKQGKVKDPKLIKNIIKSILEDNVEIFAKLKEILEKNPNLNLHFVKGNHDAPMFESANPDGYKDCQKIICETLGHSDRIKFHEGNGLAEDMGVLMYHGELLDPLASDTSKPGHSLDTASVKFAYSMLKDIEKADLPDTAKQELIAGIGPAFSVRPLNLIPEYLKWLFLSKAQQHSFSQEQIETCNKIRKQYREDFDDCMREAEIEIMGINIGKKIPRWFARSEWGSNFIAWVARFIKWMTNDRQASQSSFNRKMHELYKIHLAIGAHTHHPVIELCGPNNQMLRKELGEKSIKPKHADWFTGINLGAPETIMVAGPRVKLCGKEVTSFKEQRNKTNLVTVITRESGKEAKDAEIMAFAE